MARRSTVAFVFLILAVFVLRVLVAHGEQGAPAVCVGRCFGCALDAGELGAHRVRHSARSILITLPVMLAFGIAPNTRESHEWLRLSPITTSMSLGTRLGGCVL
jgi:hypothetical protein